MKKATSLMIVLTLLATTALIGCDNRSQVEKDADKAMKKVDQKLGN